MYIQPLVSVICTVYNHQDFVTEALRSVFSQTYARIELIVVDNASQDRSAEKVKEAIRGRANVFFIKNEQNRGLCAAFNQGLKIASGEFIIDLSADDLLLPARVEKQIDCFKHLTDEYAVVYTNAAIIGRGGGLLGYHYPIDPFGQARVVPPSGWVYKEVLREYFICTPTMMIRREALLALGGYDERLVFEDFDFWVRSSARYRYCYLDEVLTLKREVDNSLGAQIAKPGSGLLNSTLLVCEKAKRLNTDAVDNEILAGRIRTFIRKCWYAEEFQLAFAFSRLLTSLGKMDYRTDLVLVCCRHRIRVNKLYSVYLNYFYKKEVKLKRMIRQ